MFLTQVSKRNAELIDCTVQMHQKGLILPDTYVVDMDTLIDNARKIKNEADQSNIELYFMLKQLGHNPYIAHKLLSLGYPGAVVVDWKEAQIMMKNSVPICNVGHLVQPPTGCIYDLVKYGCQYFTVYSKEKLQQINEAAAGLKVIQRVLLRVTGEKDIIYDGQQCGFSLEDLKNEAAELQQYKNIEIAGITSFPCFLYDEQQADIKPQENLQTLIKAKALLEKMGFQIKNVNAPSTTSVETIHKMAYYPITSAEPGHGLTGTTPFNAYQNSVEKPCVIYLSEVSHHFKDRAYAFGGGLYRRGHIQNALVISKTGKCDRSQVHLPNPECIDYQFGLDKLYEIGSTVIMAFRFQIFVCRSDICLIEGIHHGNPHIVGIYNSYGEKKN